jgi:hypothetical protein
LAVGHQRTIQIQVKGAANPTQEWWVQYGYCTQEIIQNRSERMFNRRTSFYEAQVVVLVAVHSPREYCCVVLPINEAEQAAQLNLDRDYRMPTRAGQPQKPHKVWVSLAPSPRARKSDKRLDQEREILDARRDQWGAMWSSPTVG